MWVFSRSCGAQQTSGLRCSGLASLGAVPRGGCPRGTAEAPEHAPGPTQKGYFLVISLKIGTEFQPNFTLSTFSLKPPVVPWYQSGIEGMSSRRIS